MYIGHLRPRKDLLERGGFGAPSTRTMRSVQAFGGSGGGGSGAKLLGKAEQCLREAVAYLKRLKPEFSSDVPRFPLIFHQFFIFLRDFSMILLLFELLLSDIELQKKLLRLYPTAHVHIETPSGPHDKHNLRGKSVMTALRQAGAPNPLELRASTSKGSLKMSFNASTCLKDARKCSTLGF